jgi:hypothetical protein
MCLSDEPIPVNETPPLPGDECEEPPTPVSLGVESATRSGQEQAAMTAAELLDPDAINVVTCGTGSPLPSDRAQSCTAVFAGGQFLLFDAGDGAQASMENLMLPVVDFRSPVGVLPNALGIEVLESIVLRFQGGVMTGSSSFTEVRGDETCSATAPVLAIRRPSA